MSPKGDEEDRPEALRIGKIHGRITEDCLPIKIHFSYKSSTLTHLISLSMNGSSFFTIAL